MISQEKLQLGIRRKPGFKTRFRLRRSEDGTRRAETRAFDTEFSRAIRKKNTLGTKTTKTAEDGRKRPAGRPAGRSLRERDRDTVSLTLTDPKMGLYGEVRDGTWTGRIAATRAIISESLAAIRRNRGTTANNGNINGWPAGPPYIIIINAKNANYVTNNA